MDEPEVAAGLSSLPLGPVGQAELNGLLIRLTNRIAVRHPRRRAEVPVPVADAPTEKGGIPEREL